MSEDLDNIIGYWVEDVPYFWRQDKLEYTECYRYYIFPNEDGQKPFNKIVKDIIRPCSKIVSNYFKTIRTLDMVGKYEIRMNGIKLQLPDISYKYQTHILYDHINSKYTSKNIKSLVLNRENILVSSSSKAYSPFSIIARKTKNTTLDYTGSRYLLTLFWYIKIIKENKNKNTKLLLNIDFDKSYDMRFYRIRIDIVNKEFTNIFISNYLVQMFNIFFNYSYVKYIYIFVAFHTKTIGHLNLLSINKDLKTIELFDPYGSTFIREVKTKDIIYNIVEKLQNEDLKSFTRLYTEDICYISFQAIEGMEQDVRPGDYRGFCQSWSMWFLEMKIKYPDIPTDKLIKKSIPAIIDKYTTLRNFIRLYAIDMKEYYDEMLIKLNLGNVKKVLTEEQITKLRLYL